MFSAKLKQLHGIPSFVVSITINGCWIFSNVFFSLSVLGHMIFLLLPFDVVNYIV